MQSHIEEDLEESLYYIVAAVNQEILCTILYSQGGECSVQQGGVGVFSRGGGGGGGGIQQGGRGIQQWGGGHSAGGYSAVGGGHSAGGHSAGGYSAVTNCQVINKCGLSIQQGGIQQGEGGIQQ